MSGTLSEITVPFAATAEERWAAQREFDLRWRAWRRERLTAVTVGVGGVADSFRRLTLAIGGSRGAS